MTKYLSYVFPHLIRSPKNPDEEYTAAHDLVEGFLRRDIDIDLRLEAVNRVIHTTEKMLSLTRDCQKILQTISENFLRPSAVGEVSTEDDPAAL